MKRVFLAMALVGLLSSLGQAAPPEKIPLKVLYAGNPDSERTTEYVGFLNEHFVKAESVHLGEFQPEQADGFDVVIMDWTSTLVREKGLPRIRKPLPKLTEDYSRATLLIGSTSAQMSDKLKYNMDWL